MGALARLENFVELFLPDVRCYAPRRLGCSVQEKCPASARPFSSRRSMLRARAFVYT